MASDNSISAREFGQLESDVKYLRQEVQDLKSTLDNMSKVISDMNKSVSQAEGGWKTVLFLISAGGAIGGFIARFLPH